MFEDQGLILPLFLSGDRECQLRRGDLGTEKVPRCAELKGGSKAVGNWLYAFPFSFSLLL